MEQPLLYVHVVAATMWTGAVFMAAIVDWPAFRRLAPPGRFPFEAVVAQGGGVFRWVYSAIVLMLLTSIGLAALHWPSDLLGAGLLALKTLALAFMIGSTVYGTLRTWPRLQLSTDREAFRLYGAYLVRARLIFACGLLAHIAGVAFSHRADWFGI